ncbi:MAG: large-conductance mechanosensitive channel protein MscL [Erysipelotrichaceae bacterium]|nr:large-conductance mechanosensitive channel protein MscL [Erysipelotrichaceae bacterium]MDD4643040.1 large-conductance mechanosensitive channel protein MscL [Erysipelotrichaceae bacterium]
MRFVKEFKEFAIKGNVIDLAVGVIIGGAFGKIVSSLVADIIMPLVSLIIGTAKFNELKVVFTPATETAAEVALRYGSFIQNIIDFLLIALSIFVVVRLLNKFKKKEEALPKPEPQPDPTVSLLTEIRDELRSK